MGFFLLLQIKNFLEEKSGKWRIFSFKFDNLFYDAAVLKINKHDVIPFTNNSPH
jgi:hypothetical protein